MTVKLLELT